MQEDIKRFGFGFMRLPYKNGEIDLEKTNEMVDAYIQAGGNFFDTAYQYLGEKSESTIKKCVVERYPRGQIIISDKMPVYTMKRTDDPYEIFQEQLERCGVDYFDYYLAHDSEDRYYEGLCKELDIFNVMKDFKRQGKIKKLGLSLHDTPEVLDKILTQHPEIEFVLLQINYKDWNNSYVQSKECYDVVCKHNKPVFVMGPIKGGQLANVNNDVKKLFNGHSDISPALWALSFVLNLDNVEMILSGMSTLDEVNENMNFIKNFNKLTDFELKIINNARDLMQNRGEIQCTTCDYCKNHCPNSIPISQYFDLYNLNKKSDKLNLDYFNEYDKLSFEYAKASECIDCGECEQTCPQHLKISKELKKVADVFE
ncbi:MAG: aldo/keto reductase [Methanobrevibacter sp.]|nr:aldo/keto reductase [Methanobrevibacter sp.]